MKLSRRQFLKVMLSAAGFGTAGFYIGKKFQPLRQEPVFITRARSYQDDLETRLLAGFRELGIGTDEIKGKRILLKPNLVETSIKSLHITTHPLVVRAAASAFLSLGASQVFVGEGPGHNHDTLLVLEESGLTEVLLEDKIAFLDLNQQTTFTVKNTLGFSHLKTLSFPAVLKQVDWLVSLAKLKTHHWTGVTLSLKNLFGVMPGCVYGWPKNVLHQAGIQPCILDIANSLKPHFAIVDGIVGMEGDGPVMGIPKEAGVLVMGRNLTAVDATCARIMGIDPYQVPYLAAADGCLGPLAADHIPQRGEKIVSTQSKFELLEKIPAQKLLRT